MLHGTCDCQAPIDRFAIETRVPIDVKGKGAMQTYLLIGQHADRQGGPVAGLAS